METHKQSPYYFVSLQRTFSKVPIPKASRDHPEGIPKE